MSAKEEEVRLENEATSRCNRPDGYNRLVERDDASGAKSFFNKSKRGVQRLCETKKLNRAAISGSNGDTRTMTGEETETEGSLWSVRGEAKKWRLSAGR